MGRRSFVVALYGMAAAALVIGLAEGRVDWLAGGVVLAATAEFARRRFNAERESGPAAPRLGFFALAMGAMLLAMYGLYWLATSA